MTKIEAINLALSLAIHRAGHHFEFGASNQKLCKTNPISNTRFAMNPRQSEQIEPQRAWIFPKNSTFFQKFPKNSKKFSLFHQPKPLILPRLTQIHALLCKTNPIWNRNLSRRAGTKPGIFQNFLIFCPLPKTAHTAKIATQPRPFYAKQTQFPEC